MKIKGILLILTVLLFSSCLVKSLHPFYTVASSSFNERLIGNFTDNENGEWEIISFKEEFAKDNKGGVLKEEDKKAFETYKNSYFVEYVKKGSKARFVAMPFKVDNHLFLDLTPFEFDSNDLNKLAAEHLFKTHSAAYVELNEDKTITLKWISEGVIGDLITNNKLRIKYEITGLDEDLILTASSEELHGFLKKFMKMDIKDKWDNDDIRTLIPNNAKP